MYEYAGAGNHLGRTYTKNKLVGGSDGVTQTPPTATRETHRVTSTGDPLPKPPLLPAATLIDGEDAGVIHGKVVARYYVSSHGDLTQTAMDFSPLQTIMDELQKKRVAIDLNIRYQVRGSAGSMVPVSHLTPSDASYVSLASSTIPAMLQEEYVDFLTFQLRSGDSKRPRTDEGVARDKGYVTVQFHVPSGPDDLRYTGSPELCYETGASMDLPTIPGLTYSYENEKFSTGIRELGVYRYEPNESLVLMPIDIPSQSIYLLPGAVEWIYDSVENGEFIYFERVDISDPAGIPTPFRDFSSPPIFVTPPQSDTLCRKIKSDDGLEFIVPENHIKPIMYPGPTQLPGKDSEGDIMELLDQLISGTAKDESWFLGVNQGHYARFQPENSVEELCKDGTPATIIIKGSHCLYLDATKPSAYKVHEQWYEHFKVHLFYSTTKNIEELERSVLSERNVEEVAQMNIELELLKIELDLLREDIYTAGPPADPGTPRGLE